VSWAGLINIAATGNSLVKSGGCDGCEDASAVSEQQVSGGNGYVEFVAPEARTLRFVGFGFGGVGTAAGDIEFALRLQGGVLEVRESGAYRAETHFAAGDTLRVTAEGGTIHYSKNGSVFYTSATRTVDPMRVHVVMFDTGAAVNNITLGHLANAAATTGGTATSATRRAVPRPANQTPRRRGR